jgi:hypothetical protein
MAVPATGSIIPLPEALLAHPGAHVINNLSVNLSLPDGSARLFLQLLTTAHGPILAKKWVTGPLAPYVSLTQHHSAAADPNGFLREVEARYPGLVRSHPLTDRDVFRDGRVVPRSMQYEADRMTIYYGDLELSYRNRQLEENGWRLPEARIMVPRVWTGLSQEAAELDLLLGAQRRAEETNKMRTDHAAALATADKQAVAACVALKAEHQAELAGARTERDSARAETARTAAKVDALAADLARIGGQLVAERKRATDAEDENAQLREHTRQSALAMSLLQRPRGTSVLTRPEDLPGIPDDISVVNSVHTGGTSVAGTVAVSSQWTSCWMPVKP